MRIKKFGSITTAPKSLTFAQTPTPTPTHPPDAHLPSGRASLLGPSVPPPTTLPVAAPPPIPKKRYLSFFVIWLVSNDFLFTCFHRAFHEIPWLCVPCPSITRISNEHARPRACLCPQPHTHTHTRSAWEFFCALVLDDIYDMIYCNKSFTKRCTAKALRPAKLGP